MMYPMTEIGIQTDAGRYKMIFRQLIYMFEAAVQSC